MRPRHRTGALAVAVFALTGCTSDDTPDVPATATSTTVTTTTSAPTTSAATPSTSPSDEPTTSVGFSTDDVTSPTFPDMGGDLGGVGVVRVGRHSAFDRVVWEFPGSGRPTFRVRYVDEPTADGSGDSVEVRGDAYLEVVVSTVGIPDAGATRPPDAQAGAVEGTI